MMLDETFEQRQLHPTLSSTISEEMFVKQYGNSVEKKAQKVVNSAEFFGLVL